MTRSNQIDHIRLTSHPEPGGKLQFPITWGAATARERGPIIGTVSRAQHRNVIGTHGGSYAVYRALAVSSGALDPIRRSDLTNTYPAATIGPFPQWSDPERVVSLDPWGHLIAENFSAEIAEGIDIRPSIAVTRARLDLHELADALAAGRLANDGEVVHAGGSVSVVKIAIDPVWYLPGVARRFGITESTLRRALFEQTAGMFPELVTRPDLHVFLPPIGGTTSATARTSSGRTSAPAVLIWSTESRNAPVERSLVALASSSITARKGARSARSPSSSFTMRASGRKAVTRQRRISNAPSASPAFRMPASSN
jgi:hypothetical protein